jgi:hypothetical protein
VTDDVSGWLTYREDALSFATDRPRLSLV